MQLPIHLREAIEAELSDVAPERLAQAAAQLSEQYRAEAGRGSVLVAEAAQAYLATRLPATYAAVYQVLSEVRRRLPDEAIHSLLDCGAGPGTVMWAAAEVFDELENFTLLERDRNWIAIGKRLARQASEDSISASVLGAVSSAVSSPVMGARWVAGNLQAAFDAEPHDAVVMSYALGELPATAQADLLHRLWQLTEKVLVIVEPGTKRGYSNILRAREELLKAGAQVVAPCPHAARCPLADDDWCHFAARVERTALHRRAKAASAPYEDEKYSYFVAAKNAVPQPVMARIIRHPLTFKGHIRLALCTRDGLAQQTVTKSQKDAFRRARKADWGDEYEVLRTED